MNENYILIPNVEYDQPLGNEIDFVFNTGLTLSGLIPNSDVSIYDSDNNLLFKEEMTGTTSVYTPEVYSTPVPVKITVYLNILGYVVIDHSLDGLSSEVVVDQLNNISCKCGD